MYGVIDVSLCTRSLRGQGLQCARVWALGQAANHKPPVATTTSSYNYDTSTVLHRIDVHYINLTRTGAYILASFNLLIRLLAAEIE